MYKLLLIIILHVWTVQPHGFLTIPPSRPLIGHLTGTPLPEWDTGSMNNGGPARWGADGASESLSMPFPITETDATVSRVGGVCGADQFSPHPSKYTEGEGYFVSPRDTWTTEKSWLSGSILNAEFEITAHHKGHVEISLCVKAEFNILAEEPPTMECFNEHVLEVVPNTEWSTNSPPNLDYPNRYSLPPACSLTTPGPYYGRMSVRASFRLPDLTVLDGSQGTMLRWRYVTSNSCYPPGQLGITESRASTSSAYWDAINEMYAPCNDGYDWFGYWYNMRVCGEGSDGPFAEEFVNCADVRFEGDGYVPGHGEGELVGLKEAGEQPVPGGVGPKGPGETGLPEQGYDNPTDNNDPNDPNNAEEGGGYYGDACASCQDCEADCEASWFDHCSEPWWNQRCKKTCNVGCNTPGAPETPTTTPVYTFSPTGRKVTMRPTRTPTVTPLTMSPTAPKVTMSPTNTPTSEAPSPAADTSLLYNIDCKDFSTQCTAAWQPCETPYWRNWCRAACMNPRDADTPPTNCDPVAIPSECVDLVDTGSECRQPWMNGDNSEGGYAFNDNCHSADASKREYSRSRCSLTCCMLDNNLLIVKSADEAASTTTTPATPPTTPNVDCVESIANKITCTSVGQELHSVITPQSGNGLQCNGPSKSTRCAPGDGTIPNDINCVESTKDRSTCTFVGQELYEVITRQSGNGEECVGESTLCVEGDGTISDDTSWSLLQATHFWDCSGMGCDARTLQPWNQGLNYKASPKYAPIAPIGQTEHGEKMWMTGAASDALSEQMGTADECCGSSDEGGCGRCLLVRNANSDHPDWTAIVMKKNRCPPESNGCGQGKMHFDIAVPGYDNLQYSTANTCGNIGLNNKNYGACPDGNKECADSTVCGSWGSNGASSTATGCSCESMEDGVMKRGCELFSSWGWRSGDPEIEYQTVECPTAYKEFIASAFDGNGVTDDDDDDNGTTPNTPDTPETDRVLVGYYPQWAMYRGARSYNVNDIPAGLTHLNYAFFDVDGGVCKPFDSYADSVQFPQLRALKAANPSIKLMVSLGGWSLSDGFSTAAATEESRQKLVESCMFLVRQEGFDGIDIDWEYPGKAGASGNIFGNSDKDNFTLLLKAFRDGLDEIEDGVHHPLTIATSAANIGNSYDVPGIVEHLDFINVMTYDLHGAWDAVTDHNAPFENGSSAGLSFKDSLNMWLAAGTPKDKLVAGFAFYGRSIKDIVSTGNNGLGRSFTCKSPCHEAGSYGAEAIYDAMDLINARTNGGVVTVGGGSGGGSGFGYHWDEAQSVPWLFNPTTKVFISFDDERSICIKAKWAVEQGLRGGMFWETAGDDGTLQKLVDDIMLKETSIDCDDFA